MSRVLAIITTEEDGIFACTAQASIIQPCRLPIPDAASQAFGHALDNLDNVVDPLHLSGDTDWNAGIAKHRSIGSTARVWPVCLSNMNWLIVLAGDEAKCILQIGKCSIGAVKRIKGEAKDIPICGCDLSSSGKCSKPVFLQGLVVS